MPFYPQATPKSVLPACGFFTEIIGQDETTAWADLVSSLIEQAETKFGPRDPRWLFTGIKFADNSVPSTYYPGGRPFHVGIILTKIAALDAKAAHFQLAHEVVHLLGPSPTFASTNVLEEGMATHFQMEVNRDRVLGRHINELPYLAALAAVDRLLSIDVGAIRKIRHLYPDVRMLSSADLQTIVPRTPVDLADQLCALF